MKSFALLLALALLLRPSSCNENLNKGLQEEKSYTRAAMEKYRQDPKYFKGSSPAVLDNWSRMDYLATAVAKQNTSGDWANTAERLSFVQPQVQNDTEGKPFCVVHRDSAIMVLRVLSSSMACSLQILDNVKIDKIASGDMDFNRSDYWIYVLRSSQTKPPASSLKSQQP